MRFRDQNIIVTGGTKGIGRAVSLAFLREGASVWANYRSDKKSAEEFLALWKKEAQELEDEKAEQRLHLCPFDVADGGALKDFFASFEGEVGELHVLVNNAGVKRDAMVALMEEAAWDQVLNANAKSAFLTSSLAVPLMMKKRAGRIINMGSVSAGLCMPGQANYTASKLAVRGLTKTLAKEVGKKGITVNCVEPGFVETDMLKDMAPELLKEHKKTVPMRRFGRPEEVADLVCFLASEQAAYITGAHIPISGGLV